MSRSISVRITLYLLIFSVVIIGIVAIGVKFVLPSYFMERQLEEIEVVKEQVHRNYDSESPENVIPLLEGLKDQVGGELYYFSSESSGVGKGYGQGQGKNAYRNSNSENFKAEGDVTDYSYVNKIGLDIYVIGIALDEEYLVYEVSLQSLDRAVDEILSFIWLLLVVVLFVSIILSVILSQNISKPIKALNQLALSMKDKKVSAIMVANNDDEIGELNRTLNNLYEELLSSIYKLETELQKERNAENLKKRFLAQATHELKTPIAVIRGYSEILYDGIYKNEEDRDRYLKHIYDETESITHLIMDVLDYTKMETGNYRLSLEEVNAFRFFNATVSRFEDFISQAGKEARFNIDLPKEKSVHLDVNRIEQVLRNLIGNSVEHSSHWVEITVDAPGDKIRISVSNDGPLIDEKDLPYLFDSFYKGKGKREGSGLGLAIVKEIITLHKGEYRVQNIEDGVRFTVSI